MTAVGIETSAEYRCLGVPMGLSVLRATFTRQRFAPHSHDTYAIGAVERGATTFNSAGRRWTAVAGSLILLNPGDVHTGGPRDRAGWTYTMLYVPPPMVARAGEASGAPPRFDRASVADPRLAMALVSTVERLSDGGDLVPLISLLREIFARHARADVECVVPRVNPAVRDAIGRIQETHGVGVSLPQLASGAGLSVFHFIRAFRRGTGMTPYAYIQQQRLRLAERLIAGGESLARVALLTGFADQSHFTRAFKKRVGVTPGVFLRGLPPWRGMARSA